MSTTGMFTLVSCLKTCTEQHGSVWTDQIAIHAVFTSSPPQALG